MPRDIRRFKSCLTRTQPSAKVTCRKRYEVQSSVRPEVRFHQNAKRLKKQGNSTCVIVRSGRTCVGVYAARDAVEVSTNYEGLARGARNLRQPADRGASDVTFGVSLGQSRVTALDRTITLTITLCWSNPSCRYLRPDGDSRHRQSHLAGKQ